MADFKNMKISIHVRLLSAFLFFALNQAKAQIKNTGDTINLLDMNFDDLMN